jgi:type I restriction enzyme S subunit
MYVSLKDVTQSADLLGAVARLPDNVASGRLTQDTVKLEFVKSSYPRGLVYWALRTPSYRSYCREYATGTTTLGMAREDFLSFVLPPVTEESLLVVELLEALESRIQRLAETNSTLEAIAQALFKSWFVDFDPVHAKAEGREPEAMDAATAALFPSDFEESELGLIPKGWPVQSFGDSVRILGGGTPKTSQPEYWDGNIPWFSVVDAPTPGQVFTLDTTKKITRLGLSNCSAKLLPPMTTVISARGTVGKVALTGSEMAMNQSCYGLRSTASGGESFVYFSTLRFVNHLRQIAHGAVFDTITRSSFDQVSACRPHDNVIARFGAMTTPLLNRVRMNGQQAALLTTLRDTLLPRLISGKLRLPEAMEATKEALA